MSEDIGSGEREYSSIVEYRHRHIDIDITKKRKKERRFYIPQSFEFTFGTFLEILHREGCSLSKWLREEIESYVRLHEPGNPQQRLDIIMKLGKAYHAPSKICGFKDCLRDAVAVGLFIPNNKVYALCQKHLGDAKDQRSMWKILNG